MPSRRDLLSAVGGLGVAGVAGVVASKTEYAPSNPPAVSDPPTGPNAWPLPRFDARNSGRNPDATVPRETPTPEWTLSLPYAEQPVLAAGRGALRTDGSVRTLAVAGNDHVLRRLPSVESTASRWRTPLSYHPTHLVAGAETVVCAGFDDHEAESDARAGRVGAYDRETGETLWELTLGSPANGLAVADGVYVTQRTTWRVGDDGTPVRGADAAHPTVVKLT